MRIGDDDFYKFYTELVDTVERARSSVDKTSKQIPEFVGEDNYGAEYWSDKKIWTKAYSMALDNALNIVQYHLGEYIEQLEPKE